MRNLIGLALLVSFPVLAFGKNVGLVIGTYDMFTLGHLRVIEGALNGPVPLEHVYISVNHNTAKDPIASTGERIEMVRAGVAHLGDKVTVLREPLEGRVEFARYLLARYGGKVLAVFGDDTFNQNYLLFTVESQLRNFDYLRVVRPVETMAASAESVYVPDEHEIEIDADGLSSTLGRKLIAAGEDPVARGVLQEAVYRIIQRRHLYHVWDRERSTREMEGFAQRFVTFRERMRRTFPLLSGIGGLEEPVLKAGQSRAAQSDKFIRHMVEKTAMPLENQWEFRSQAENYLGLPQLTQRLRRPTSAGAFLGSFDLINAGQRALIKKKIEEHQLKDFYIGVLRSSRKPIRFSVETRIAVAKEGLKHPGVTFHVEAVDSLEASPDWFRRLASEHETPVLAFFGSNVFEQNEARLGGISNLKVVSFPVGAPISTTSATTTGSAEACSYELAAVEAVSGDLGAAASLEAERWFYQRLIRIKD